MTEFHITWIDIAVAVMLTASILLAIYRGFVRETLSVFAWIVAVFATLYFGHYVVPLLAPHMSFMLAQVLAYTAVFLLVLMPLLFIGNRFSRRVHESAVGVLDRILGALFGAVRGLAVIAIFYIVYSLVVPIPVQAKWMREARTLPLIQRSATVLLYLLPDADAQYLHNHTERGNSEAVARPVIPPAPHPTVRHLLAHHRSISKGYGAEDQRALNRLIETGGGSGNQR